MSPMLRRLLHVAAVAGFALAVMPATARAQEATVVSGRVTSAAGAPVPSASVFIQDLGVGSLAGADGR